MSRKPKSGLDYFPLDTVLDTKFDLIEAEFGLIGFAVIVRLYQKIYGEFGYYCEWTREVALLFSQKMGEGYNVVSEIVSAAIKRGIFNGDLFEKYSILTSKGIQERFFEAVSRRKRIEVDDRYLLVKLAQKQEYVYINLINVDRNSKNVDRNKQSKVKESKVYYSDIIRYYTEKLGKPDEQAVKKLQKWSSLVAEDMIMYAIDEAATKGVYKYGYVDAVLSNHYNAGRRALTDIKPETCGYNYDDLEQMMREK